MTDETTPTQGGGEALPSAAPTSTPAPRNDAEAAAQQATQSAPETDAQKAERDESERKKNRTKDYIDRINRERSELAAKVARLEAAQNGHQPGKSESTGEKEPTLEDFDWDMTAFNKAHTKWSVDQALSEREKSTKQAEDARKQQELVTSYNDRAATFAEDHPDFTEAVGSIPYQLSNEIQAAIMAHERGPEIAYHLANNDDDAFNLSNVLPHVAAAAVERLAKRITAAPQKPESTAATTNQLAQPAAKPITNAPKPPATVTGRTPTDVPAEKLTDDEWYRRDKESRRKR